MNRRRVGFLLIGVGVVIGLIVGVLVFFQASEAEQLRQANPKRLVAVATADIAERTTIAVDQIRIVAVPDEAVPPGSATILPDPGAAPDEVDRLRQSLVNQIRDQFTTQRIYRGEIFNKERLGREALKNNPSFELPAGKVAYPFPIRVQGGNPQNERLLVGFLNAVRPGDFIDVYYSTIEVPLGLSREEEDRRRSLDASRFLFTRRIMQNIKVMNVGFFPDAAGKAAETPREERYLTLQVTPDEALTLKWLKDAASFSGNLEFVLRSPLDTADFPSSTMTYDLMSSRYSIGTSR